MLTTVVRVVAQSEKVSSSQIRNSTRPFPRLVNHPFLLRKMSLTMMGWTHESETFNKSYFK